MLVQFYNRNMISFMYILDKESWSICIKVEILTQALEVALGGHTGGGGQKCADTGILDGLEGFAAVGLGAAPDDERRTSTDGGERGRSSLC